MNRADDAIHQTAPEGHVDVHIQDFLCQHSDDGILSFRTPAGFEY
jgi:hypothetical protein